jgi:hypothetical protein
MALGRLVDMADSLGDSVCHIVSTIRRYVATFLRNPIRKGPR